MNIKKMLWTVLAGLVVVAAVLFGRGVSRGVSAAASTAPVGRSAGNPGAAVKIVEYTDFQCPACAKASDIMHEEVRRNAGKIFLELKYFPLPMHKNARRAAVVAECSLAQDKFWFMEKLLFSNQKSWEDLANPDDYFLSLARGIGCDDLKMMRCMSDSAVMARIDNSVREGQGRGVKATPTFFVNGKMVVGHQGLKDAVTEGLK
ncbi:MAG: thioredoxin domain-containing protein [Candidatus Omnitrophota bacterium]